MKILVSGVCGFVGSTIANGLLDNVSSCEIIGIDNLSRAGSQVNLEPLQERGVAFRHADLRCASDLESIGRIDWIIDAAANPSVLAGVDGTTSSRQLTTNAFKAYRREVIEGCQPLIAPHFNITVEIPLKAIVRGFTWTTIPITWRNRRSGTAKLKIKEMGSRYLFTCLYVWLEKYFSAGDYRRSD